LTDEPRSNAGIQFFCSYRHMPFFNHRSMSAWYVVNLEAASCNLGPTAIVVPYKAVVDCCAKEIDPARIGAKMILRRHALEHDPDRQFERQPVAVVFFSVWLSSLVKELL
jgi:hypothetical protein